MTLLLSLFLIGISAAQEPAAIVLPQMEGTELLRAMSLDLRGVVPSMEEYQAVQDGGAVDGVIDQWLDSPGFTERVVKQHRSLLWNNVSNVRLTPNQSRLITRNGVWFRNAASTPLRGVFNLGCTTRDAEFDEFGWPIREEVTPGVYDEGSLVISPYWDPENPVRVCAFDAMEQQYAPDGTDCGDVNGIADDQCGCGPDLQWCIPVAVEREILDGMGEDVDHRIRAMVDNDQPYTELLTGNTGYLNGPVTHFLTHQTERRSGFRFSPNSIDAERLPDLAYTDDGMVPVALGDHHSGVLTSPAWLLRFQTQRSRANQFHNSFLCQPFVPPSNGLPEVSEEEQSLDLTARDGCQYCHALLEPAAAHWGRWAESGAAYLEPETFPAFNPACLECSTRGGCTDECRTFYVTQRLAPEQDPFIGYMNAFEFLEDRHATHVDQGPALLVNKTMADGRLPECVAEKTAEWLLGRSPTSAEEPWVEELATRFAEAGFDYKTLIRDIVTSENYRRLP